MLDPSWQDYVVRIAGFTAASLVVTQVLIGIGQATKIIFRYIQPERVKTMQRWLAIALAGAIFTHVFFIVIAYTDNFNIQDAFIPFLKQHTNGSAFAGIELGYAAVGFGILAMYSILIMILSSLGVIKLSPLTKRKLPYFSYMIVVLVFLHGLYVGTNLGSGLWRIIWLIMGIALISLLTFRLVRPKTPADN